MTTLLTGIAFAQGMISEVQPVASSVGSDGTMSAIMAIITALLAISEGLGLSKKYESNGIVHGIILILKRLTEKPPAKSE